MPNPLPPPHHPLTTPSPAPFQHLPAPALGESGRVRIPFSGSRVLEILRSLVLWLSFHGDVFCWRAVLCFAELSSFGGIEKRETELLTQPQPANGIQSERTDAWRFRDEPYAPRPLALVHVPPPHLRMKLRGAPSTLRAYVWRAYRLRRLVPSLSHIWLASPDKVRARALPLAPHPAFRCQGQGSALSLISPCHWPCLLKIEPFRLIA